MGLGIAMLAYKRPRYLYVALHSLFRVDGIEECHVGLFVDHDPDTRAAMEEVISQFDVETAIFHESHLTNFANQTFSLNYMCDMGFAELLYLDEDHILRTDTLSYLRNAPRDAFFLSLYHAVTVEKRSAYCPMGNLVTTQNYRILREWIDGKKYYGLERPGTAQILDENSIGYDAIYYSFLVATGYETRFSPVHYAAHFGLVGWNHKHPDEKTLEVETRMFSGPREAWMDNVLREFHTEPKPEPVRQRLIPHDFEYK